MKPRTFIENWHRTRRGLESVVQIWKIFLMLFRTVSLLFDFTRKHEQFNRLGAWFVPLTSKIPKRTLAP